MDRRLDLTAALGPGLVVAAALAGPAHHRLEHLRDSPQSLSSAADLAGIVVGGCRTGSRIRLRGALAPCGYATVLDLRVALKHEGRRDACPAYYVRSDQSILSLRMANHGRVDLPEVARASVGGHPGAVSSNETKVQIRP